MRTTLWLLSILVPLVLGPPIENLLGNILRTFSSAQSHEESSAKRGWNFWKRKSNNRHYYDITPGVDTDSAPTWTLNHQYRPPLNHHLTSSGIETKKNGFFGFLPDLSLPKFEQIFTDLNVKRKDVENAIQEVVKIPSFENVAKTVQDYFRSSDDQDEYHDSLSVVYDNAIDRQDLGRQGVNNRALVVGTAILLSLITGGSIGTVITEGVRKVKNEKDDKDKKRRQ